MREIGRCKGAREWREKFQSKTGINVYYKYRTKDHKHLPIILNARLRALFCQEASATNIQEHVKL